MPRIATRFELPHDVIGDGEALGFRQLLLQPAAYFGT
jgi:hypothetical protein